MSRVQLALNVSDIDQAVAFYAKLFNTEPAKRRPGYANFTITEPPLKLVLLQGEEGQRAVLDHLGIEVGSTEQVTEAIDRLNALGMPTRTELDTTCCYARQDKVWVQGPGQEPWEVYTVKADSATFSAPTAATPQCCSEQATAE